MNPFVAGLDVSLATLDGCLLPAAPQAADPAEAFAVPNDAAGHAVLIERLLARAGAPTAVRVVLESTGGMEEEVMLALQAAGIDVTRVQPRQVRHFARAQGHKAKTDALDARLLADYGRRMPMTPTPLPDEDTRHFRDLLDRRQQLLDMKTMEEHRVRSTREPKALASVRKHLRWIETELQRIDAELDRRVATTPARKKTDQLLQSVPGLGRCSSYALIGYVPELGTLDRKAVSLLVGLAPLAKDSGTTAGQRHIVGGRKQVRNVLYMAALAGMRSHPGCRALAGRLLLKGKPKKVAIIAVAHKLLILANSLVRQGVAYDEGRALRDLQKSPQKD